MNKQEIEDWLKSHHINEYTINDDLTVDVNTFVDLTTCELTSFPFQFGSINGHFLCGHNGLTSLKNCPKIIFGSAWFHNNKLTSLEHCPIVHNGFYFPNNNLTSLEHCQQEIYGNFSCSSNNLTSLEHSPKIINGDFFCQVNKLTSLEHCPKIVHGEFICDNRLKNDPNYLRWLLAKKLSEL